VGNTDSLSELATGLSPGECEVDSTGVGPRALAWQEHTKRTGKTGGRMALWLLTALSRDTQRDACLGRIQTLRRMLG
jgi:hypothetical protein